MLESVKVQINNLTVSLVPPTLIEDRLLIFKAMQSFLQNQDLKNGLLGLALLLKTSLKSVELRDGSRYPLQFSNGELTTECVSKILRWDSETLNKLSLACFELMYGIPFEFTDQTGEPLAGAEILPSITTKFN